MIKQNSLIYINFGTKSRIKAINKKAMLFLLTGKPG